MLKRFAVATFAVLIGLLTGVAPASAQTGNPLHDGFSARDPSAQRSEVFRFINASGAPCQAVIATFFAGLDDRRTAYWDSRCAEGGMYRISLPASRSGRPGLTQCGAASGGIAAGPCFQPVGTAVAAGVDTAGGRGIAVAGSAAQAPPPPGSRFGAVYATDAPLAAWGFANGNTDRLAVNTQAVRACQSMAGRTACKFIEEIVNRCGALVQGVTRHPNAVAITSDLSTVVLNRNFTGTGATAQEAEQTALDACRGVPGVICRVAVASC